MTKYYIIVIKMNSKEIGHDIRAIVMGLGLSEHGPSLIYSCCSKQPSTQQNLALIA